MKKIICLIESLGSGGAERQMAGLAVLLKEQGYNVEVWTYYPNDFYLPVLQKAEVPYRYIADAQSKRKRLFILSKEFRKAKPDTVIAYLDAACMVACIMKIIGLKFKLIVSERNTTQFFSAKEKLKFFLYRFANHIVPNSHTQTDIIKQRYPKLALKLKCITNFVDTDRFFPVERNNLDNTVRILTVARVTEQKNVINYIKAIKLVVNSGYKISVDWYGAAVNKPYIDLCRQTIIENDLSDVFHFHDASTDIINQYQSSDIFCLPSIYEGFPNVVCEAMCCGLPIVCSEVCDNAHIVVDGLNGYLFNPRNIDGIKNAIIKCITDKNLSCISVNNRERALLLFSKKTFISEYKKII